MAHKVTITVSDEAWKFAEQYAEYKSDDENTIDRLEALSLMLNVARGRLLALKHYAHKVSAAKDDKEIVFRPYVPLDERFADERAEVKEKAAKIYKRIGSKSAKASVPKVTIASAEAKAEGKPSHGKKASAKKAAKEPVKKAPAKKAAPAKASGKAIDLYDAPGVAMAKAHKIANAENRTMAAVLHEAGRDAKGNTIKKGKAA